MKNHLINLKVISPKDILEITKLNHEIVKLQIENENLKEKLEPINKEILKEIWSKIPNPSVESELRKSNNNYKAKIKALKSRIIELEAKIQDKPQKHDNGQVKGE